MIRTSEHHAQRLSQMLDAYELPPRPNCFDPVVANFHFADLAYLFPLLIEEKRTQIVAYQHALEQAAGHEELIAQLASLLDENQTALDVLERDHRQIAAGSKIAQHG